MGDHTEGDLTATGLITNIPLDVRVMPGCLILTARESAEPEIMQTPKKVCKLSAREQRRVTAMIEVISRPQSRVGN